MLYVLRFAYVVLASIVGFIFASIFHTQVVLAKLSAININITISERLQTTFQDLMGLAPTYGLGILLSLLLAFSVAGLINKFLKAPHTIIYSLAGGVGFFVMLMAMRPILNVTLIAGARGVSGLTLQVCAGIIAGICFAYLLTYRKTDK